MTIILRIQNAEAVTDGGPVEFRTSGRSFEIGRDQHLDWTLPDQARYISSRHCEVRYENGGYWLYDVSSNGTFLNGSGQRMKSPYRLTAGDRLGIGHYLINVDVDEDLSNERDAGYHEPQAYSAPTDDIWSFGGAAPPPIDRRELQPPASYSRAADFSEQFLELPNSLPPVNPAAGFGARPAAPMLDDWAIPPAAPMPAQSPPPFSVAETDESPFGMPAARSPNVVGEGFDGGMVPVQPSPPEPADPSRPVIRAAPLPGLVDAPPRVAPSQPAPSDAMPMPMPGMPPVSQIPMPMPPRPAAPPPPAQVVPPPPPQSMPPLRAASPMPMPQFRDPQRPPAYAQAPAGPGGRGLIDKIAAGAGVSPEVLAGRDPDELAQEIGEFIKVSVEHLTQLLRARAAAKAMTKSSSRTMIAAADNNPLKFLPAASEAIEVMFARKRPGYMNAKRSVDEAFGDLKRHEIATYSAMQKALGKLLDELSPESIESKITGAAFGTKKGRAWDLFVSRWEAKNVNENGMLDTFLAYFSEAYDEAGRKK